MVSSHICTWENPKVWLYKAFVSKVMCLLFNMLSRSVTAFLPGSKHLLISWLQSPSTVILEPRKIKSVTPSTFSPFICDESDGTDAMVLVFLNVEFQDSLFSFPLSLSSRGSLVPLHFLPLLCYHLHIWGCWYFSQWSWFLLVIHSAQHFTWCTLNINEMSYIYIYTHTQPCHTPLPILNQFIVPCSVLTVASWPTYRFLRIQVR